MSEEEWVDITDFLDELSQEMSVGQMIHTSSFDLKHVISATEVMDPRMDNGMKGTDDDNNNDGYHQYTVRELIDLDIIPNKDDTLPLEQQLVIMERMLSAQVLFMGGAFLPQTLMTCLYIYDDAAAAQRFPYLRAFMQTLLKSADHILETVQRTSIRDEDEFAPVTFGLSLCHQKDTTDLLEELDALVGDIDNVDDDDMNVESKIRRFIYIHMLILKGQHFLNCGDVPKAQPMFNAALHSMQQYRPYSSDTDIRAAIGFEPVASHRISAPSPVPEVAPLSIEESKKRFTQYIENMFLLCDIVKCVCLSDFSYFFETFIHSESKPQITERSYLIDIFMGGGQNLVPQLVQRAVLLYINECNIYTHQPLKEQYQEQFSKWIDLFSKSFVEILTIKAMNLPAQQRELRFNITNWGTAEQEAEQLDHKLLSSFEKQHKQRNRTPRRYVLSMFTLSWLLYTMELFLLRGFETDIYHYSEYITVLWYLDYIASMRVHNFSSIDKEPLPFSGRKGKKGKRNIREYKKAQQQQNTGTAPPEAKLTSSLPSSRAMLEMRSLLYRGIFRFYAALLKSGHYVQPQFPFGSDELRFEHRFRPFFTIVQPTPVDHKTYKNHIKMDDIQLRDLINSSIEHLETVKLRCSDILKKGITGELITEELRSMMKVAQGNAVSLRLVNATIQKPAKKPKIPDLDFSFHRHFPVIKIKLG